MRTEDLRTLPWRWMLRIKWTDKMRIEESNRRKEEEWTIWTTSQKEGAK
jgi:hypothetical protein